MSISKKDKKSLLPQGFYDIAPPDAFKMIEVNYNLLKFMQDSGYELVRPTIMEFEEFLDKDFSSEFFKVTDPLSGKMLAIRNDITPQIVRIVKEQYLKNNISRSDIKISYTGQIFRKTSSESSGSRQLTQTGYEYIGKDSAESDAQIINFAVESLRTIGKKDFAIDFSFPSLFGQLIENNGLNKKEEEELLKLVEQKDTSKIEKINKPIFKKITSIIVECEKISNLDKVEEILSKILNQVESPVLEKTLNRIIEVCNILKTFNIDNKITISLFEKGGFKYHTGLCYSFISRKNFEEVGRGGRYLIKKDDREFSAVGFTFLLDSLLDSLN